MTEEITVTEKLREKIAKELYDFAGRYGAHQGLLWKDISGSRQAEYLTEAKFLIDEFIKEVLPELAKEVGYIPLHSLDKEIGVKSLEQWAKAEGYVKLASDQSPPSFRNAVNKSYNDYMLGQEDMKKAGWRKVESE